METPLVLTPAYGRKYSTEDSMIEDFNLGKDFKILSGPYCSIRDFEGKVVSLRFHPGCYTAGVVKNKRFNKLF